jgi:hypothetical protein
MLASMTGFADRVRIKRTEETERLGLAGREGQVFGHTTPSVTEVAVPSTFILMNWTRDFGLPKTLLS